MDDSLLHAPDADDSTDALDALAKQGNLTASSVWKAAVKATGGGHEDTEDADAVQPSGTSIAIDRSGSGVVINYGFRLGFFLAFAAWAAGVALMLAAARLLPEAVGMRDLESLVAWIPEIPYAASVAATLPLAWFIGGSVVSFFAFLMWAVRVRKVEIALDAVRIWRGAASDPAHLRPSPLRQGRADRQGGLRGQVGRVRDDQCVGVADALGQRSA